MNPIIVHVHVQVKPDGVEAFKAATLANARASRREPGVARFDAYQQADEPTRFLLIEEYKSADAPAAHKATAHYAAWRDAVAPLMAVERRSVKYAELV
jgi:quinol monooxygenase YgiN